MKCLSVSQPFAELIMAGMKSIDLRGWNTRYRGDILVHAPQKIIETECQRFGIDNPVTGVIVGRASLVDVKRYHDMSEINDDFHLHLVQNNLERNLYGFLLEAPYRFATPIPQKGRLGLFEVRPSAPTENVIISDIMDEHHRYQYVGRH
ncbi:MAG: ASCH domain-containing protein [Cenarchaeum sp. SB0661_bin_35]|nr:ASCH domain-containing protein [Cenarchaeum sp. SB0667_bin_13]MYC78977.1 ASCH domain-containing protein [Cenarchaeum sp. SB0661_bin_35]MYI51590.1 ASCH domain-containing protein [Cenarchaeum sp. SB0673_bin_9]